MKAGICQALWCNNGPLDGSKLIGLFGEWGTVL